MWKRKGERDNKKILPQPSERVMQAEKREVSAEDVSLLSASVERLAVQLERANFAEYVQLMQRPWRIIFTNLLAGIARGLGVAIGFTLLAAILLYLLQALTVLNLPIIGDFIADIVRIVQSQLNTPTVPH